MNHKCSCVRHKQELCICTRQLHLADTSVTLHRLGTSGGAFYVVFTRNKEYRFILSPIEILSIYNNLACIIEYMENVPLDREEQFFVWRENSLTLHVLKQNNCCKLKMTRMTPFHREFDISFKSLVAVFYFLQSVFNFINPQHQKYIGRKMKLG